MSEVKYKVGQKLYQGPYWGKVGKEKYKECQVISCDLQTVCYMSEDERKIPIIEFTDINDCNLLTEEMYEKQQSKTLS